MKRENAEVKEEGKASLYWVFWIDRQETQLTVLGTVRRVTYTRTYWGFRKLFSVISQRLLAMMKHRSSISNRIVIHQSSEQ